MPMPKETPNENRKRRSPEEAAHRSDSAYPAGQDVKAQQERLRKAAVVATAVLKPATPSASPAAPQTTARVAASMPTTVAAPKPAPVAVQKSSPPVAVAKAATPTASPAAKAAVPAAPKPAQPAPAKAAAPAAPKTRNFTFVFHGPDAKRVTVSGEFNGWSPEATPMKRRNDGEWETTLALKPGRYQYKFVVDGNWTHDPNARENVRNEHGSLNSVTEVRA